MGSSSNFEWQILAFQDRTIWSGLKLFCQELNNLNKAGEFKESFSEPKKKGGERDAEIDLCFDSDIKETSRIAELYRAHNH